MQSGITRAINNGIENAEEITEGTLNFLNLINYDDLISTIFDVSLFDWVKPLMDVLML